MGYVQSNKLRSAINEFRLAIEADPRQQMAYVELAASFRKRDQNDHAKEVLMKCVDINPSSEEANFQLGSMLEDDGDTTAALRHYEQCLRTDHAHAKAHFGAARLYFEQKRFEESMRAFETAYRFSERLDRQDHFEICMILGVNAAQPLNRVPFPDRPLDVKDLHHILIARRVRPYCSAVYGFRILGPEILVPLFNRPDLSEYIASHRKKAILYLREAIRIDPKSPRGYLELAELYLSSYVLEDNRNYIALARNELEMAEKNSVVQGVSKHLARALFLLGVLDMADGKHAESITRLQRADRVMYFRMFLAPGLIWDELIPLYIGFCFEQLGEFEKAVEFYRRASERQFNYPAPYVRLGLIFLGRGDTEGALRELKTGEFLGRQTRDPIEIGHLLWLISNVYSKQGNRLEAIKYAVEATKEAKRDVPEFLSFLAQLYQDDGQSESALKTLDKAIGSETDPEELRRMKTLRDEWSGRPRQK